METTGENNKYDLKVEDVLAAKLTLNAILDSTPLIRNRNLSDQFENNIYLKREDLQTVRSYKIRGAYKK